MSWIESHQSLLTHRKMLRLEAKLKTDRFKLIGHLHALWWWGLDNATNDGVLTEIAAEEIASACGWPMRKAGEFTDALIYAGFIDETARGFVLHNWRKYAGKLNEKRAKDRHRKQEAAGNSSGIPVEGAAKSQAPDQPDLPTYLPNLPDQPTGDSIAVKFGQFGRITAGTAQAIAESITDHGLDWVDKAVSRAAGAAFDDQPGWNYIESILQRWQKQGHPDEPKETRNGRTHNGRTQAPGRAAPERDYAGSADRIAARLAQP